MALLVYKIAEYEHTAEREQYRTLCKQLKAHYEYNQENCIFIANYNIFDCELDGIIIKNDGIIGVEFKNYGGLITAVENGEWKLSDGTIIKGGSRKTVYQQSKLNHVAIKRGLKEGVILPPHALRNIAFLVVFHQPIHLDNRLSRKVQSWLHICDEETFIEKVQDITSQYLDLSEEDFLMLISKLALQDDFLDEKYSNRKFLLSDTNSEKRNGINENKHKNLNPSKDTTYNSYVENKNIVKEEKELKNFTSRIISTLYKGKAYEISVFNNKNTEPLFKPQGITSKKTFLITVEAEGIRSYRQKISKFINRPVEAINSNLIFWEEGEELHQEKITNLQAPLTNNDEQVIISKKNSEISFRKSKTVLPHWLDKYLFSILSAEYAPEYTRYSYNLDLNEEEIKIYLGTYFPRSYSEMFCICDNLLRNMEFRKCILELDTINILDVGCGTGGEILGLIIALTKHISENKTIKIVACDGNKIAINILSQILNITSTYTHHNIEIDIKNRVFESDLTINKINNIKFNFILCDKLVCELISHKILTEKPYSTMASKLMPLLADLGIFIMLDLTTKDEFSGLFYPQLMNIQLNSLLNKEGDIETLLPLSCGCFNDCREECFLQQTFYVSHSQKTNDESRVCYRIMCKKGLKKRLLISNPQQYGHIIHPTKYNQGDSASLCKHSTGNINIDSFNINY